MATIQKTHLWQVIGKEAERVIRQAPGTIFLTEAFIGRVAARSREFSWVQKKQLPKTFELLVFVERLKGLRRNWI
jgi:hypothetical protein